MFAESFAHVGRLDEEGSVKGETGEVIPFRLVLVEQPRQTGGDGLNERHVDVGHMDADALRCRG